MAVEYVQVAGAKHLQVWRRHSAVQARLCAVTGAHKPVPDVTSLPGRPVFSICLGALLFICQAVEVSEG